MSTSLVDGKAGNTVDNGLRSIFPPQYSITRGEDDALQWEPPIRSRELANALSYHYPMENSLREKMQRAILDFLESEIADSGPTLKETKADSKPPANLKAPGLITITDKAVTDVPKTLRNPALPSQTIQGPEMCGVWDIKTGESVKAKGRKRGLSPTTRKEVARNRGNTCEYHQKTKTRCDPTQCRQNKLYPGTDSERERDLMDSSPSDGSQTLIESPAKIRSHGCHLLKPVNAFSPISPRNSKSATQSGDEQMPPDLATCDQPGSCPSFEDESVLKSLVPYSHTDVSLKKRKLLDGSKDPAQYLVSSMAGYPQGSEHNLEGEKLFPGTTNTGIGPDFDAATVGYPPPEYDIQRNWHSTEVPFGGDNIDWIEALIASEMPALDFGWPVEFNAGTNYLNSNSDSKELFDWSDLPLCDMEDSLGDLQFPDSMMDSHYCKSLQISPGTAERKIENSGKELEATSSRAAARSRAISNYFVEDGCVRQYTDYKFPRSAPNQGIPLSPHPPGDIVGTAKIGTSRKHRTPTPQFESTAFQSSALLVQPGAQIREVRSKEGEEDIYKANKRARAAKRSASASNTKSLSRPPHHGSTGSGGYSGLGLENIENMYFDPLIMAESDSNVTHSSKSLPRPLAVYSTKSYLEPGGSPPIRAPYGSPQAYVGSYQPVPISEPDYSNSSGHFRSRNEDTPFHSRSLRSSNVIDYLGIVPASRDQNLLQGHSPSRSSVESRSRQCSDKNHITASSTRTMGDRRRRFAACSDQRDVDATLRIGPKLENMQESELDSREKSPGPDGDRRSSLQRAMQGLEECSKAVKHAHRANHLRFSTTFSNPVASMKTLNPMKPVHSMVSLLKKMVGMKL